MLREKVNSLEKEVQNLRKKQIDLQKQADEQDKNIVDLNSRVPNRNAFYLHGWFDRKGIQSIYKLTMKDGKHFDIAVDKDYSFEQVSNYPTKLASFSAIQSKIIRKPLMTSEWVNAFYGPSFTKTWRLRTVWLKPVNIKSCCEIFNVKETEWQ